MTTSMTSTELSLLSIREGQVAFDEDQKKAIVDVLRVRHATDADLAVFFHMAIRTNLDPFRRQLYMIARQEWDPETRSKQWRQTFQTGIDGYRVVAAREAARRGLELKTVTFQYWDKDGTVTDAWWKDEPPAMIRATVQLGDQQPVIWDARWSEYVPMKDEYSEEGGTKKKTGKKVPQGMWATRPTAQLEKCAEAGALRRACPEDLSNLYVDAELERTDAQQTVLVDDGSQAPADDAGVKHDWIAETKGADREKLRCIWRESSRRGEKSPSVMAAIRARTAELEEAEKAAEAEQPEVIDPEPPAGTPVDAPDGHDIVEPSDPPPLDVTYPEVSEDDPCTICGSTSSVHDGNAHDEFEREHAEGSE
jgi:phage recombination protein Bet